MSKWRWPAQTASLTVFGETLSNTLEHSQNEQEDNRGDVADKMREGIGGACWGRPTAVTRDRQ